MSHSPTMKDVAAVAGVHQTTVSLALRHHHSIPAATRERILKIASDLGYRRNPLVSALMAQRKKRGRIKDEGTLAFLTSFRTRDEWRNYQNYRTVLEAMERRAEELGYRIAPFWLREPGVSPERMKKILLSRGIRGAIVCPLPQDSRHLALDFSELAAIALGQTLLSPRLDNVAVDYYSMMQLALTQLSQRGFRRIGFTLSLQTDARVNHLSLGAYLAWRLDHPRQTLPPLRTSGIPGESLIDWMREKRPDALITASRGEFRMAKAALEECSEEMPHPIQVISLDTPQTSTEMGVVQNLNAEATAAVDLVTSRLERGELGVPAEPRSLLVQGFWRDGLPTARVP